MMLIKVSTKLYLKKIQFYVVYIKNVLKISI